MEENEIYGDGDEDINITKAAMQRLEEMKLREKLSGVLKRNSEANSKEKASNPRESSDRAAIKPISNSEKENVNSQRKEEKDKAKETDIIEITNLDQARKAANEILQIDAALSRNKEAKSDAYINLTDTDCSLQKLRKVILKKVIMPRLLQTIN